MSSAFLTGLHWLCGGGSDNAYIRKGSFGDVCILVLFWFEGVFIVVFVLAPGLDHSKMNGKLIAEKLHIFANFVHLTSERSIEPAFWGLQYFQSSQHQVCQKLKSGREEQMQPLPGHFQGHTFDIISAFQVYGEYVNGSINDDQRMDVVRNSCPGAGACGGMYTANTMASAIEAMGMSLPYSSSTPAEDPLKLDECRLAGKYLLDLIKMDLKPRDIITLKSLRNAIVIVMALGGSTNAVLHLIAIARSVGLQLTLDDFQKVSDEVPFLADLKPSGKYVMEDVHKIGGTPAVIRYLLELGLLDGDCMTVTGKTLAENAKLFPALAEGQQIIRPIENPIKATGHIQILYGNLAPEGSVAKITGKEGLYFSGAVLYYIFLSLLSLEVVSGSCPALVFEGEESMIAAIAENPMSFKDVALLTDGRFSGGSHGYVVGHICPEAQVSDYRPVADVEASVVIATEVSAVEVSAETVVKVVVVDRVVVVAADIVDASVAVVGILVVVASVLHLHAGSP
ncbi:hypothetical protein HHK36_027025 [Tetracentron sinense]|uniref:Dihydroxy-acid dehydratase n=1 Tax=Tetracentron sinense TaxID=13715 RepID=A0A834YGW8_TETSI|nr:hypothetical protein HHK36_027025 [Tetracentron sinense]